MAAADAAVLDVLRDDILDPRAISLAVEMAVERYLGRAQDVAERRRALEADVRRVEAEIARPVDAVASG